MEIDIRKDNHVPSTIRFSDDHALSYVASKVVISQTDSTVVFTNAKNQSVSEVFFSDIDEAIKALQYAKKLIEQDER